MREVDSFVAGVVRLFKGSSNFYLNRRVAVKLVNCAIRGGENLVYFVGSFGSIAGRKINSRLKSNKVEKVSNIFETL